MFQIEEMSEADRQKSHELALAFMGMAKLLLNEEAFKTIVDAAILTLTIQGSIEKNKGEQDKPSLSSFTFTLLDPDEGGDDRNN